MIDYREYLIGNEESQKVDFVRGLEGVYENRQCIYQWVSSGKCRFTT